MPEAGEGHGLEPVGEGVGVVVDGPVSWGGQGDREDVVEPVREDVEAADIVENVEGLGDTEGLEGTEDTKGVEDVKDMEDVERGGHRGHGNCGGQEGSNLSNIVILCNTYCNYTMNSASCNDI